METLEFTDGSLLQFALPAPTPTLDQSCFAFSLHKAGSSLLNSLLHDYSQRTQVSTIDISSIAASHGDDVINITAESGRRVIRYSGYGYWGWRNYAACLDEVDFSKSKNLLLVRDPRDRLVSQFFSFGRSHTIPEEGTARALVLGNRQEASSMSIDDYALAKLQFIDENWSAYHRRLNPLTTRVYRYEDVIFRKEEWLEDIVDYLKLPHDADAIREIAKAHDILPKVEDPDAHIRQVRPGNFRAHLAPATIDRLGRELGSYLQAYQYLNPTSYGESLVFAEEGEAATRLFSCFS